MNRLALGLARNLCLVLLALRPIQAAGQPSHSSMVRVGPVEFHDRHHGGQEQIVIGGDAVLKEGESNRTMVVILGDATIDGTVNDLICVLCNVKIGPTGDVKKGMVLVGGQLDLHPDAKFSGFEGPKIIFPPWLIGGIRDWFRGGLFMGRPMVHRLGWVWATAGAFLVLYLLAAALAPRPVQACVQTIESSPVTSFLTGMIALLLAGPLLVLLVASVVGLIVLPFLLCVILAGFLIGRTAVFQCIGQQLGRQSNFRLLQFPLVALIAGCTLILVLYIVPVLGFLVWGLVGTLGFGAAVLAALKTLRAEMPRAEHPGVVLGRAPTDSSQPAVQTSETETPVILPAAGFWMRLAATALDATLVGILVKFFFGRHLQEIFIPVWFLYHVALWAWKGTTLGGIVLRLKIVRLHGNSINFAVALVRSLAAFFSALVFCLGFFWVGWNRERQSWHDIIAGTVIVRMPAGDPMV